MKLLRLVDILIRGVALGACIVGMGLSHGVWSLFNGLGGLLAQSLDRDVEELEHEVHKNR